MKTPNESGFPVLVANFEKLINICISYGSAYNPSKPAHQIGALQQQLLDGKTCIGTHRESNRASENKAIERKILVAQAKKKARKIVYALASIGTEKAVMEDARHELKKINGERLSAKPAPDDNPAPDAQKTRTISSTQTGFDSVIEHFARLITIARSQPAYLPNEPELHPAGLMNTLQALQVANTSVMALRSASSADLIKKDQAMNADDTGMADTGKAVKLYIKSVFGPNSPEYKQVRGLRFIKRK